MERAVIAKDKLAGYSLRVGAYVLDEDEFGVWLWTPAGSVARYFNTDEVLRREWPDFLSLAQSHEWFWAGWWHSERGPLVSVDACTPPQAVEGTWRWTDLELDVMRDPTGVWLEDEDELVDAVAAGLVDAAQDAGARAIAASIERRLVDRVAPFDDDTGWRRFEAAVALDLAPLAEPAE